jgi:predicted nucleic acid-binding protein
MMVVDASVWMSAMVPGDVHHLPSGTWVTQVNRMGARLGVPAHFPAEVTGAMHRLGAAPHPLELTIATLFDPEFFELHEISTELARYGAVVGANVALRGSDALYVALATTLDLPLVTWDKQQRERGAVFCRTMTPVEAMELYR